MKELNVGDKFKEGSLEYTVISKKRNIIPMCEYELQESSSSKTTKYNFTDNEVDNWLNSGVWKLISSKSSPQIELKVGMKYQHTELINLGNIWEIKAINSDNLKSECIAGSCKGMKGYDRLDYILQSIKTGRTKLINDNQSTNPESKQPSKHKCTCSSRQLFQKGCTCGGI